MLEEVMINFSLPLQGQKNSNVHAEKTEMFEISKIPYATIPIWKSMRFIKGSEKICNDGASFILPNPAFPKLIWPWSPFCSYPQLGSHRTGVLRNTDVD